MSVGGTLRLSRTRLVFTPGRVSRSLGRRDWVCELTKDVHVGVAPRGRLAFLPGMQRRFVVIHEGAFELFEIHHVETVIDAINTALAAVKR